MKTTQGAFRRACLRDYAVWAADAARKAEVMRKQWAPDDFSHGAVRDGVDAQGRPKYRPAIKPDYAQPQGGARFEGHDAEGLAVYSNVVLS